MNVETDRQELRADQSLGAEAAVPRPAVASSNGRELLQSHFLPVAPGERLRVVFESDHRQREAVFLKATVPIQVAGQTIEGQPLVLWRNKAPEMVMLTFPQGGELMVRHAGSDAPSMIVQPVLNGFRYRCMDPQGDEGLVFRVESVDTTWM